MTGPTSVPCRVTTPSTAASRGSIRRITLIGSPTIFVRAVVPLAPPTRRRTWSGRSRRTGSARRGRRRARRPTPAPAARRSSPAWPSTFGTLGTPASLPSCVVTIFESRCVRSVALGNARSRPSASRFASVSSSNIRKHALPAPPRASTRSATSLWPSRWLTISSIDSNSWYAALLGHEHVRVRAVERVEPVHEREVPHPAVDAEQVEGRRGDEVDRRLVRAEERADLRDALEHVAGLGDRRRRRRRRQVARHPRARPRATGDRRRRGRHLGNAPASRGRRPGWGRRLVVIVTGAAARPTCGAGGAASRRPRGRSARALPARR